MASHLFVFFLPFAIVIMSYIECYPYLPDDLKTERSYNENNGLRTILDRMIEMRDGEGRRKLGTEYWKNGLEEIPPGEMRVGTKESTKRDGDRDLSPTDIPEANSTIYQTTQKRLRMAAFYKTNLNVPDYGFYPLSLEDLDTFKKEGKIEKDNFKRMATELYLYLRRTTSGLRWALGSTREEKQLSLRKLLDRVEEQNK